MIKYALICDAEHEFDVWFADSKACDDQLERGLVECPVCGSVVVRKQIMAPAVGRRSGGEAAMPAEQLAKLAAKVRDHIGATHEFVGDRFAAEARAMHNGEVDHKPIYGEATRQEAVALARDGVPAAPLPPMLAPKPPKKLN
ncbi:MAG: DUF1178 family protein [Caulobacterales bacterium]|nr:DUF1178 family protein [Caulobacterales bacterium]